MGLRKFQTFFLFLSLAFLIGGIAAVVFFGLDFGIEFTGGSMLEASFLKERPSIQEIRDLLKDLDVGSLYVQEIGEQAVLLRMKHISQDTHQAILSQLGQDVQELRFESLGPVIGKELREKTLVLAVLAVLIVVLYIAFAFRRTFGGLRPWHWSLSALVASLHDVFLPLGIFAALGEYQGMQITIPVVVALLTVIGYSINDTVVVFDRIRENLSKHVGFDFADTVQKSLAQTWMRSLSTSLTTLFVLFAIFFFGGTTLKEFSLMLIFGIIAGTSSSLFLAPQLLCQWQRKAIKV